MYLTMSLLGVALSYILYYVRDKVLTRIQDKKLYYREIYPEDND